MKKALQSGLLLALPIAAGWCLREPVRGDGAPERRKPVPEPVVSIPVEVIASGRSAQLIYVEVGERNALAQEQADGFR